MKCYICGDIAIKRHNYSSMCEKHYRFRQMQKTAKADKKVVPSFYELEKMVPDGMICQDCGCQMHWIDNDNRSLGAVLQHYRDGTLAIVCNICNIKHGGMPGDTFREVPIGHKRCVSCKTIKPLNMFSKRYDGVNPHPLSKCKVCAHASYKKWREKNKDKYRALNKKHNDIKKQNPEKYRELDRLYYQRKKERKSGLNSV